MFSKIVSLAALVAVACAQHGHEHGHAYSSQSFVLHQEPSHQKQQQAPAHHLELHHAPIVHHAAPVFLHAAPEVHHIAPAAVHQAAPALQHAAPAHHEEQYYSHPKYEYVYNVEDKHTGDIKSAQESRDGDVVKGEYSLHQPDGRIRTVKYTADKHSGFNAEVHYSGEAKHSEPQQQQQQQHNYHH